jgi:hypothetical protein
MADTLKRLYGPTVLTSSAATKYTVPGSTTTTVRTIIVTNGTASSSTFTLSIGADATGTRLFDAVTVPSHDTFTWSGILVLAAAEVIQALSPAALNLTLVGIETT